MVDQPETGPVDEHTSANAQADAAQPSGESAEPASPADTFKQGMGLLWKAAQASAHEIKAEVNKQGVGDSLKRAGRDLEDAANQAAKALESFIDRVGPQETPPAQQGWPVDVPPADDSAKAPPEGDMRVQVEED